MRPSEIGIDSFQADRSPTHMYRTAPLAGLWTHQKGGFYHDGRFATLLDVVEPLRRALQAEPQRREQEGPGRVPEGDLNKGTAGKIMWWIDVEERVSVMAAKKEPHRASQPLQRILTTFSTKLSSKRFRRAMQSPSISNADLTRGSRLPRCTRRRPKSGQKIEREESAGLPAASESGGKPFLC